MKKIKKLTAMLFALTCILALGVLAHAADDGKVLIEYRIDPEYADTCELYMGGSKGSVFTRELNSGTKLTAFGVWACEKGNPKNNSKKVEMTLLNDVSGLTDRGAENTYHTGEIISVFNGTDAKVSTANGFMFTNFYADTTPVVIINVRPDITVFPPEEPTPAPQPTTAPGEPITNLKLNNAYIFGKENYVNHSPTGTYYETELESTREITREEVCALIGRILAQNGYYEGFDPSTAPQFSDVPSSLWSYKHIGYAASKGAFNGKSAIAPQGSISRGETAHILSSVLNLQEEADLSGFSDITEDTPYASDISKLVALGLMKGDNNNQIHPGDTIIRAEIVAMLNRLTGRDSSFYKLVTDYGSYYDTVYFFMDLEANWTGADPNDVPWYHDDMVRAACDYDENGYINIGKSVPRSTWDN